MAQLTLGYVKNVSFGTFPIITRWGISEIGQITVLIKFQQKQGTLDKDIQLFKLNLYICQGVIYCT